MIDEETGEVETVYPSFQRKLAEVQAIQDAIAAEKMSAAHARSEGFAAARKWEKSVKDDLVPPSN